MDKTEPIDIELIPDREIEIAGVIFNIRQPTLADYVLARRRAEIEADNPDDEEELSMLENYYLLVRTVKHWKGIHISGAEAECNMQNKEALFSQRPDLAMKLIQQIAIEEEEDQKNLKTSQGG